MATYANWKINQETGEWVREQREHMATWSTIGTAVEGELAALAGIRGLNYTGVKADDVRNLKLVNQANRMTALADRLREHADRLTHKVEELAGLRASSDPFEAIKEEVSLVVKALSAAGCLKRVKLSGTTGAVYFHGMRWIAPDECSHDEPYGIGLVIDERKWDQSQKILVKHNFEYGKDDSGIGFCPTGTRDYRGMTRYAKHQWQLPAPPGERYEHTIKLLLTCNPEAALVMHEAHNLMKRLKVRDPEDAAMLTQLALNAQIVVHQPPGESPDDGEPVGIREHYGTVDPITKKLTTVGDKFFHIPLEDGGAVEPGERGEVLRIDGLEFIAEIDQGGHNGLSWLCTKAGGLDGGGWTDVMSSPQDMVWVNESHNPENEALLRSKFMVNGEPPTRSFLMGPAPVEKPKKPRKAKAKT